jgi:hypothetical protein
MKWYNSRRNLISKVLKNEKYLFFSLMKQILHWKKLWSHFSFLHWDDKIDESKFSMFIKISLTTKNILIDELTLINRVNAWLMKCLKWSNDSSFLSLMFSENNQFSKCYVHQSKSKYWRFLQVSWNAFMNDESSKEKNFRLLAVLKSCELSFFIGDFVMNSSEQATIHNF